MNLIRFIVGIDRGPRSRGDADKNLAPVKAECQRLNLDVLTTLKVVYSLVCNTDQATFETVFATKLQRESVHNWKTTQPIVIPYGLKLLGVVTVCLDRQVKAI